MGSAGALPGTGLAIVLGVAGLLGLIRMARASETAGGSSGPARSDAATSAAAVDHHAQAEGNAPSESPEALVAEALRRAPSVTALTERLRAAEARVEPASAWDDPMVELMVQNVGAPWDPMASGSMAQVGVTQRIEYPGKREARTREASSDYRVKSAELAMLRAELGWRVRSEYARIFAVDEERKALVAARAMVRVLSATVSARYAVGQAEPEMPRIIHLEALRLDEQLTDLDAERSIRVAALNQLLLRDASAPLGPAQDLPEQVAIPSLAAREVTARAPVLAMRRAERDAATARVALSRIESHPNFLVGVAAGSTFDASPVITVRFGLELPVAARLKQVPLSRASSHELGATRAELVDEESKALARARQLQIRWNRDNEQLARYAKSILPEAEASLGAVTSAYAVGRGDFTALITSYRDWLEARVGMSRRRAERFATWGEIRSLLASDAASPPHTTDG